MSNVADAAVRGAVAIGRNEGERLVRCLQSLSHGGFDAVVYVDSGSVDDSIRIAESLGAHVVQLDMSRPFTAGRARNEGFARLREILSSVRYVQFVDGDCVLEEAWPAAAQAFLDLHPDAAIACGRRSEIRPEASIYNQMCDLEWDTPIGVANDCGGDFMVRTEAFAAARGFDARLIAGEEPELCYRLRRSGWQIHRLDTPMTWHDAAIHSFRQWARRTRRSGYAYIARAFLHWQDGSRYCWRPNLRIAFWALLLPLVTVLLATTLSGWFLALLALYPVQFLRLRQALAQQRPPVSATATSFYLLIGKWLEFGGQIMFLWRIVWRREQTIIEYK